MSNNQTRMLSPSFFRRSGSGKNEAGAMAPKQVPTHKAPLTPSPSTTAATDADAAAAAPYRTQHLISADSTANAATTIINTCTTDASSVREDVQSTPQIRALHTAVTTTDGNKTVTQICTTTPSLVAGVATQSTSSSSPSQSQAQSPLLSASCPDSPIRRVSSSLKNSALDFASRFFNKCKAATFTVDGATYTIGKFNI